jgi:hypothetical protein
MSMEKKTYRNLTAPGRAAKVVAAKIVLTGVSLVAAAAWASAASAQDNAPAAGGDAPAGGDNGGGAAPAPAPAPAANAPPPIYGGIQPPAPGVPLGGGNNTESSSQPVSGDGEDHFDNGGAGGAGTVHGGKGGYAYLGGSSTITGDIPSVHVVRRGDTLWGICDTYFHNPYQWPRIWSYNPQLQNPHWIYPGDQIRMRAGGVGLANPGGRDNVNMIEKHRTVLPDTIFLRDEGYVEDDTKENWGEITGAPEERIFLADLDEVYLHIANNHDVKLGEELTVFRPTRSLGTGQIVQIQGTVRIDDWDAKTRVARGRIVETLDTIERGARVGPVGRRFDVVAPVRNEVDLQANVIASVRLHAFFGQNQVVFVDKGADDGLKVGNRFFVMRRGDAWRQTLVTDTSARRISVESLSPAEMERVPRPRDESKYPQEVTAELRVLSLHPHSATCLVTQSVHEIELGELAVAKKGY